MAFTTENNSGLANLARELRDRIDFTHAIRMSEILGCHVVILRRVPKRDPRNYRFTGLTECVYGVPAEFIEQAQSLGLLAEAR